jgi:hypothetical protein
MMMMKHGECDIGRLWAEDHRAAEYLGIEAPGALDVIGDDEVGHYHSLCGLRGFGHWHLHSLGPMPRLRRGLKPAVNHIGSSRGSDESGGLVGRQWTCPSSPEGGDTCAAKRQDGIVLESLDVMIGKQILVGITHLGSGDEPDDTVQLTGAVTAVEPLVTIDHGQPAPFTLPPFQDAYDKARRAARYPGIPEPCAAPAFASRRST